MEILTRYPVEESFDSEPTRSAGLMGGFLACIGAAVAFSLPALTTHLQEEELIRLQRGYELGAKKADLKAGVGLDEWRRESGLPPVAPGAIQDL